MDEQQNQESVPEQAPQDMGGTTEVPTSEPSNKGSMGPIFVIVVVIIILLLGGFYFWGAQVNDSGIQQDEESGDLTTMEEDVATEALMETGTSDEVVDLEVELDVTNLDDLDAELGDIDQEFNF